ncbi:MAG: histidine phosphatase family protein [Aeoliella sp.]
MKQLLLVQPGATEYDQQGRIQGTLDVPLSEDGRQQVEQMAGELRDLRPTSLLTAPGQASRQTGELLGEVLDLKPRTLDKLKNVDQGLWQGMCIDDVKAKQPKVFKQWLEHPETVCPPEGETIAHAKQRVGEVLHKLIKKQKPDTMLLLVAPEPVASVVRYVLCDRELGDLWHAPESASRWELIDLETPKMVEVKG